MELVSPGSSANVEFPTSATGRVANGQDLQLSVTPVMTDGIQPQFSPHQIKDIQHNYELDGDRMQCECCGFWYGI